MLPQTASLVQKAEDEKEADPITQTEVDIHAENQQVIQAGTSGVTTALQSGGRGRRAQ